MTIILCIEQHRYFVPEAYLPPWRMKAWINDLYADEKWWIETKSQISISSPPLRWYFVPGVGEGVWEQEAGHQPHMTHHQQTDSPLILFFLAKLGQVLGDMMNRVRHSATTDRVIFIPYPYTWVLIIKFMSMFIITKTIHLVLWQKWEICGSILINTTPWSFWFPPATAHNLDLRDIREYTNVSKYVGWAES